jgi:NAD+ synthase (glutamine-hydrolysing)
LKRGRESGPSRIDVHRSGKEFGYVRTLRIALAQVNTAVGDIDGNARLIIDTMAKAREDGAELVAFPELAITGYPPEDLVLHHRFVADNLAALDRVASEAHGIAAIVGFVDGSPERGEPAYNAAAFLHEGAIASVYRKIHLPNYGVFDEERYFERGTECPVIDFGGVRIGVSICEDVWEPIGPAEVERDFGAEINININASPFERGKDGVRRNLIGDLARRNQIFACYVNQVGGQDELVFDGTSLVYGPDGSLIAEGERFSEDMLVVDLDLDRVSNIRSGSAWNGPSSAELAAIGNASKLSLSRASSSAPEPAPSIEASPPAELLSEEAEVYRALVLGTRDYALKSGFKKAVIALSGGIDSTLTAVIAVDALGAENVLCVAMPSRYSSDGSVTDAEDLSKRVGIQLWNLPIEPAHAAFEEILEEKLRGTEPNVAEENVQSRVRGNVIMTISNKFGYLVLTTGNKSEFATGYATLYGDMAGGYAVIKDVPKTLVFRLCEYRNATGPGAPIPRSVIDKPPSAELRPDQLDSDSLPPYEILDRILEHYIEDLWDAPEIIAEEDGLDGGDEATVRRVLQMVDRNEYKRRQSPPGVKITQLAFGRDRRMPIASRYRPH